MKTILVVDDFASVRLYHSRFLSQKGFRCVEACDGVEALKILDQSLEPIDLVLLDLVMPSLDGAAFVAQLRGNPTFKSLPILAITSEAMTEDTRRLEQRFGIRTLLKPVLPDALFSRVQEALG
jgi:two-component system, chemotaxis family, chemotaxis protein CheY